MVDPDRRKVPLELSFCLAGGVFAGKGTQRHLLQADFGVQHLGRISRFLQVAREAFCVGIFGKGADDEGVLAFSLRFAEISLFGKVSEVS